MSKQLTNRPLSEATNYFVFEDHEDDDIDSQSPWSQINYLEQQTHESDTSVPDDIFTDVERRDIISAYTPQELRLKLIDMIDLMPPSQADLDGERIDLKTRNMITDALIEIDDSGFIRFSDAQGTRLIYDRQFIGSFQWLAEQSLQKDTVQKEGRIRKWLRRSADDSAEALLDRVGALLTSDTELRFGRQPVLSDQATSGKVDFLFLEDSKPMKSKAPLWDIKEKLEVWGYNTVRTATESLRSIAYGQLIEPRVYVAEVLDFDMSLHDIERGFAPTLGDVICRVLDTSVESPSAFLRQYQASFKEFEALDQARSSSPIAQKRFDERLVSFIKLATTLHAQRKGVADNYDAYSDRHKALLVLSEIGGSGPLRKLCLIVARELDANTQVSLTEIEHFARQLSTMNHMLSRYGESDEALAAMIEQVKDDFAQAGVKYDDTIFARILFDDSEQ